MEKKKRPTDISQLAYQIVQEATQEVKEEIPIRGKESRRRCAWTPWRFKRWPCKSKEIIF
jgi:hypothetical protein